MRNRHSLGGMVGLLDNFLPQLRFQGIACDAINRVLKNRLEKILRSYKLEKPINPTEVHQYFDVTRRGIVISCYRSKKGKGTDAESA